MIGSRLGAYEIRAEIGRGGVSTVYRAYQPNVDRDVAIKVIRRSLAGDERAVQRFHREACLIARLEHPHILPIYDFDGGHDPPYIVMRCLDCGSLAEVLAQGMLSVGEVIRLARQVAAALNYAHRQGVVHRDVKPSNILIDAEGNACVTDFGLAQMVGGPEVGRPTAAGWAIVGTPHYMSPEQASASADVDHRSDVYALGVILFEMLTGRLPFDAEEPLTLLAKHMQDPIPSSVALRPELPPAVDAVFARALAKDRDERYDSVLELAEAMAAAVGTVAGGAEDIRPQAAEAVVALPRLTQVFADMAAARMIGAQKKTVTALWVNAGAYASAVALARDAVEAAREAIETLWEEAQAIITAHGGMVLSPTQDTALALWGVDATREDDAERAIRAALAVQTAVEGQTDASLVGEKQDGSLPLNIGLHTGLAHLTPGERSGEWGASGVTIRVVERLAEHADGAILISHATYGHVRGVFRVEPDVALRLERGQAPVPVYRVHAAKPRAFRVTTRGVEGVETAMVGRAAELKTLQNAFLDAVEDVETHVITLVSEAGLGKSRLLYEFNNWAELHRERPWIFRGRATPEMTHRPYALLRDLISFRFDIRDSDGPEMVRQKLETGIRDQIGPDDEMAHLLGYLAGFDLSESRFVKGLLSDARQLTERAKQFFLRWVGSLRASDAVVIQLEDIHHADDASLDLLSALVSAHTDLPLLVICLARPTLYERRPTWGSGQPSHTRLELGPLDKRDSRALVREVLQKVDAVPRAVRDLLVERAEGNPYYLEELVKMLIDDRVIIKDSDEVWRVEASRLDYLQVPVTLVGLLQARLDSLLYLEKLTLQRAAVVGRIFYDSALEALDGADELHVGEPRGLLERLAERGFIFKRETTAFEGSTEYIFGSNMLRDVLLDTLLCRQLQVYNGAAAQWLIRASGDRADEYSALIAEYYNLAGAESAAADWYSRAGRFAQTRGATAKARRFFDRALELAPLDDLERRWIALLGRDEVLGILGDIEARLADDTALLALAEEMADDQRLAEAYFRQGNCASTTGSHRRAVAAYEAALAAARRAGDRQIEALVLGMKLVSHTQLGEMDAAVVTAEQALARALELGDESTLVRNLHNVSVYYSQVGDHARAAQLLSQHVEINQRLGDRIGEAKGQGNLGYSYVQMGLYEMGRATLERALRLTQAIGARRDSAYNRLNLALAYMRLGDNRAAQDALEEALPELVAIEDVLGQAACRSYLALVLESCGDAEGAVQGFAAAEEVFTRTGACGFAIDALVGLARCALVQGKLEQARRHAMAVWDHLDEQGAKGLEFPILAYHVCAQAFDALGEPERARAAVEVGYRELMAHAAKISDVAWRDSFLENVPEHRAVIEKWHMLRLDSW